MTDTIEIRATRPFFVDGKAVPAGTLVHVSAIDAGQIVGARRAEYVNEIDIERFIAASRAAAEKMNSGRRGVGGGWIKGY